MHAHRDADRLVECLNNREPFYMASMTGGPITPRMDPSVGQMRSPARMLRCHGFGCLDYVVWSYETPIAFHCAIDSEWIVPTDRYSRTTAKHQHIIRMAISSLGG